jgi:large subunit ribosomal protein L13
MEKSVNRRYHHFDAQGKVVGRLAVEIARVLSGRDRVDFTPHIDQGDFVVVTNTDGLVLTGNKPLQKLYHHYSGYPGGIKSISFRDQMKKDSRKVLEAAVYGMLPKNKLRDRMMTRLLLVQGAEHEYTVQVEHTV